MLHPWSLGDNGEIDRWKEISSEATSLFLTPGEAYVMKVTYPPCYFLTFITSNGLYAYGHTNRPSPIQ
jgi:hypothetical protein